MSDDLIKRSEAIEAIMRKPVWHASDGSYYHIDDIKNALNELPSVQTKGKWSIKNGELAFWDVCSECGKMVLHHAPFYNFCPNCGADMRGTDDERKGD